MKNIRKDHKRIWETRGFSKEVNENHTRTIVSLTKDVLKRLTVDMEFMDGNQWADKYRTMGKRGRYMRWDSALTPYLTDIAADLSSSDSNKKIIVVGKPSQHGGSGREGSGGMYSRTYDRTTAKLPVEFKPRYSHSVKRRLCQSWI